MRPTRFGLHGILFYAALVVAFYAAPYSNLFFLLLGFLTLLALGGAWSARRNLAGVSASLAELEPVPSGSRVRAPLVLRAPGSARFQIAARLELAGGGRLEGRIDVLEGEAKVELRAASLPRGCHAIERALVESSHPFGILRARRAFVAPAELVVHPAPRALRNARSVAESLGELFGGGELGGDLQPASLRDHRDGEGLRGVHWRASARRGRLVVQEWEGGRGEGLEVVLDRRSTSEELEDALATISALVELARAHKETLRVHTQGLSATFGAGNRPWRDALRFLAGADALPADAAAPPPASPSVLRLPVVRNPVPIHAS